MTIADNYQPVKHTGNGSTVEFSFDFNILVASYLKVYFEVIATGVQTEQTTGFSVVFSSSGGVVTFDTPPADTVYVILAREIPYEQNQPYKTSTGFDAVRVEQSFDKAVGMIQQVRDMLARCLIFPIGSTSRNITLPTPLSGKALLWNDDEDAIINSTDDFNDIVTNATTQAGLAAASAVSAAAQVTLAQGFASDASDEADRAEAAADSIDFADFNALTEKTTLADNDKGVIEDSEALNAKKSFSLLAVWNYIKGKMIELKILPKTMLEVNTTFTVGTGGDYTDLATACYDVYNKYYPKAVAGGITVEIKCLSGYIMSNPLHIRQGVDMGFIAITGEDTVVKINPASWANGTTRAFYGILNTTLPSLQVRFDMEGKQNSASQNVDGLMVTYSSKAVIADGGNVHGIINCSGRGVYAFINSEVDMNRTVVSSTTTDAVVAERGSKIWAGQTSATHGGSGVGYRVINGSIIYTKTGTGFSGTVSQTVNTVTGSGIIFQ